MSTSDELQATSACWVLVRVAVGCNGSRKVPLEQ